MTEETRATTRITGTLQSVDGKGVVRMDGRYDTGIDDLWSAVSDPARLARWIAEVDGDLHVGRAFRVTFTSGWEGAGREAVSLPAEQDQPHVQSTRRRGTFKMDEPAGYRYGTRARQPVPTIRWGGRATWGGGP